MPSRPGRATPLVAVNVRIDPEIKSDLDNYCQTVGISMRVAIEEAVRSLIHGMRKAGTSGDAVSQPEGKPVDGIAFRNLYPQGPNFTAAGQGGSPASWSGENDGPVAGNA